MKSEWKKIGWFSKLARGQNRRLFLHLCNSHSQNAQRDAFSECGSHVVDYL